MDLDRPLYPDSLVDRMKKEFPFSCIGCEFLRALPDRTMLCAYGGSPRKVDVLDPLMSNRNCKHNKPEPSVLDRPEVPIRAPPRE
ncbi:hypothetical protein [Methanocella sp. MCL-LM]|uniref:hypothetical protein n=1 Tax=Methanocella sp. MCL-LM TaxID=3412035 RepID=UPI003C76B2DF